MKNDGGPAFPQQEQQLWQLEPQPDGSSKMEVVGPSGMSLLDYFAGQAIKYMPITMYPGSIADAMAGKEPSEEDLKIWMVTLRANARTAFGVAEAMLAERERRTNVTAQEKPGGSVATTFGGDPDKELAAKCRDEADREGEAA